MHGVLGVFAMVVAMTHDLRRVWMARFVRRGAECNSPESAADEGKRDCEREGSPNPVAHVSKIINHGRMPKGLTPILAAL